MVCLLFRGKNVCIYHILDSCKFGAARCVYSHSSGALPKRGWWNSPEKVAKVKEVLDVAEKNAKEQRQVETVRWRAYVKEMRGEVRNRRALEKQKAKEQPPMDTDADKKKVGAKARKMSADSKKEDGTKKGVEEATEQSVVGKGVKPEEKNTGQTAIPGVPPNSTTAKKGKARRGGKTRVVEPGGAHQKKTEGGANRDASDDAVTSPPSVKKGLQSYHHHRRRNPRTEAAAGNHSSASMT
jgi:hypothetical protein